jgi:hypothetical protein
MTISDDGRAAAIYGPLDDWRIEYIAPFSLPTVAAPVEVQAQFGSRAVLQDDVPMPISREECTRELEAEIQEVLPDRLCVRVTLPSTGTLYVGSTRISGTPSAVGSSV